ncbi:RNA-binding domain, S1 [Croceitalea dokdonensis DOKDO 023]|uniref:RNA-binding domain, S1 n=1 Tax=Croceitalea dokdonensis DOKDO 023 TaxID=1300341 RepID=A0A0P7AWU4_9FLAO|nr:S1-like domain-containing RNA-binding protein [Croceitalea dokdonensis]KPM33215.1 RNA-binding domain, S1 [Croceitalea dokdonensis DOKDO 023]
MIQLGNYNDLRVDRSTSVGLFLSDDEGTEILLPNKYVPENIQLDEVITVFCYLDHQERPVATTLKPEIKRNGFAFLKVAEVNQIGAFLDWGLEKHLLVPFSEQRVKMEQGRRYIVHCYLDDKTFRLVGSAKIDRFFKNEETTLTPNDQVSLLVSRHTDLGWEVIVDNAYKGLIFHSDNHQDLAVGKSLTGYVKNVRPDFKIDVALAPIGAAMLEGTAATILAALVKANGFLPLHDKSAPEDIRNQLKMSKKAFKKGVGVLYKERKIEIQENGINLV